MAFDWQVLWNQAKALALNLRTLAAAVVVNLPWMAIPAQPAMPNQGFGSSARQGGKETGAASRDQLLLLAALQVLRRPTPALFATSEEQAKSDASKEARRGPGSAERPPVM